MHCAMHCAMHVQIFWNCVVVEMVVQFLWGDTDTATQCDEADETALNATATANATAYFGGAGGGCSAGRIKIVTMIITGIFAAACLIATAVVCRITFRLGNRPMRRRWVGLARHAAAWAFNLSFWVGGCWVVVAYGRQRVRRDLAAPPFVTSDAAGPFGFAQRCSALEKEHPLSPGSSESPAVRVVRRSRGYFICCFHHQVAAWVASRRTRFSSVTGSQIERFARAATQGARFSHWFPRVCGVRLTDLPRGRTALAGALVGFAVGWVLMEPLWIVLITLLPCLCNTRLMNWMNDRAGDLGFDLSLFLG